MDSQPTPRRVWMQFVRQALGGQSARDLDPAQALDLAAAFCRCRAAALFKPLAGGKLGLQAASAALRGQQSTLEQILGPVRDASGLRALALAAPSASWPLSEILEVDLLVPLRGLALALECLAVSLHTADGLDPAHGFALFLWEEEEPSAAHLDRAQIAALALCCGLEGTATERPGAEDARRAHDQVLRQLESMANRGPGSLDNLAPHSRLLDSLEGAVRQSSEHGQPLALVLIDADDLAGVNRAHGPQAGDHLLQEIASVLLEEAGQADLVVRYGMEEFALLVPDADPGRIRRRAEDIQRRIRERHLPGPSPSGDGSVSVGVACLPDSLATDAEALRLKAEQALEMARLKRPGGLIIL